MITKTAKEKLLAIFLVIAAAVAMMPGGIFFAAQDVDAASTITLTGKKFEYKDAYGKWHTNTYFSGGGYEGLCAKAHYHAITGKHTYTMHNSANFCKGNIMAKLSYHYGYVKGWTGGTNGAKLSRCLNYVSTQSGAKDKGKAFNFKEKTLKDMVSTAKDVTVPEGFECWFVIPAGDTSKQAAVIWKYTHPGTLALVKSSSVKGYKKSFAGCEYTVYQNDKKTTAGKLTCRADGTTNSLSLQPGTYYVKETKSNADYMQSGQWYTAKVTSKKTLKIKASDSAEGSVSIQKAFTPDSDDGYTLEGFVFTLQNTADSKLKYTGKTDANGRISIKSIKAGTYTVTENLTDAQQEAGYSNESKQGQKVTIGNDGTAQITWKNSYRKANQLMIVKTTDDGTPVDGFHFDVSGEIRGRELTADTFTSYAQITPVTTKEGFTLGPFVLNEEELADLNNAAESKETGTCTVHVTAQAVKPAEPPQGKELDAFLDGEGNYAFAEGDALEYEGILYIAQTARTYSRDQILGTGDEECLLDDVSFFKVYEADYEQETITVPVQVTLRSVREKDEIIDPVLPDSISEPDGWTITYNNIIWAGSADSYQKNDVETTTGENGVVRVTDLFPGTYTVTEEPTEEQKKHFRALPPQVKTLEEGNDAEPIVFRFENKAKVTPVSLIKTNPAENGEVTGFEFTLTGVRAFDEAEVEPVTAVTEEGGRIDFGEIYAGSYVIEETGFDPSVYTFHEGYRIDGHENPAIALTVTGEEKEPIELTFENDPITNLFLTKVDQDTQMFLDGAVFDLYENGKKVVTFCITRGDDGKAKAEITWQSENTQISAGNGDVEDSAGAGAEDSGSSAVEYNYAVLRGLKRHAEYRIVETKAPSGYAGTVDYGFTFEEGMAPVILENVAPQIRTMAREEKSGLHMSNAGGGLVTLIDTVMYQGLTPGKTYTMTGRLVHKPETQEEANALSEEVDPVKAGGRAVEKTVRFTPAEKDGSVDIPFTFDASALEGTRTVIFESLGDPQLKTENSIIATHSEADNEDQSIYFPALHTTATGEDTGLHITDAAGETVINDKVDYSNVIAGRVYEVSGTLVDKETGRAVTADGGRVTAAVRFKATENGPVYESDAAFAEDVSEDDAADEVKLVSGSVDLRFVFDSGEYTGKSLVAFEELRTGGQLVGQHKDLGDAGQTVNIPAIETKASASGNGIKDKVSYRKLIPGESYIMRGVMMDQQSGEPVTVDGQELSSDITFTPAEQDGSVTLQFDADMSALRGRTLVAFETCYLVTGSGEVEIANHRQLDAESQTVSFRTPQTGQTIPRTVPAALTALLLSAAYLIRRLFFMRS